MGKANCLSSELLGQLQLLHRQGLSQRKIADQLGCSKTCVQPAVRRLKDTGSVAYRLRPGPTPKTDDRLDRRICRMSESNRRLTAVDISRDLAQSCGIQLHPMTIRRRLKAVGLHGRIARRKPFVSLKNRQHRMQWARQHAHWTAKEWSKVLWSDESKFSRTGSDGRTYIRRRVGEEFHPRCTIGTIKHGGGKVMVWAAFSRNGTGPITQIKGIMDSVMYRDILANHLEDAADGLPLSVQNCWEFQQDNDPKHTSRLVKSWLKDNKIRTMEWPAQSPDLNPIEH